MITRFNDACVALYTFAASFKRSCSERAKKFMSDERGLSGVVVAVLLILVAVLAVVGIWGALDGWLGDLWGKITGKTLSEPSDYYPPIDG